MHTFTKSSNLLSSLSVTIETMVYVYDMVQRSRLVHTKDALSRLEKEEFVESIHKMTEIVLLPPISHYKD